MHNDIVDKIHARLNGFEIETPSWGYADTGTRFGKFFQAAAAIDIADKIADAGQVHRVTGCCRLVALHILWDFDESTDTWDTVDWLVKRIPNNNGKVGIAGISYPGFYTAAGIIDSHPAIKAASPQAPVNDWFVGDDWHHNGAFFLAHMFNFMSRNGRKRPEPTKKYDYQFDYGTPDGYQFYLPVIQVLVR